MNLYIRWLTLFRMDIIKIKISENDVIFAKKQSILISKFIKNKIDNIKEHEEPIISINNISTDDMNKILEWCDYHFIHPDELENCNKTVVKNRRYEISEWNQNFFGRDLESLFNIAQAASYLEIEPLMNIFAKQVVNCLLSRYNVLSNEFLTILDALGSKNPVTDLITSYNIWESNSHTG